MLGPCKAGEAALDDERVIGPCPPDTALEEERDRDVGRTMRGGVIFEMFSVSTDGMCDGSGWAGSADIVFGGDDGRPWGGAGVLANAGSAAAATVQRERERQQLRLIAAAAAHGLISRRRGWQWFRNFFNIT